MTIEDIVERFGNNELATRINLTEPCVRMCLDKWSEPHRYYHGLNHLSKLLEDISSLWDSCDWSIENKEKMDLLALFHDVVYDPRKNDNECASVKFIKDLRLMDITQSNYYELQEILVAIDYTKYSKDADFSKLECDNFIRMFCYLDIGGLTNKFNNETTTSLIAREMAMLKEFQFVDFPTYRKKRIEFLQNFPHFKSGVQSVVDFLTNYRPKIGVYPGSFNPFSVGHLDILEQAEKIFDKVIVVVGRNPDKDVNVLSTNYVFPQNILPFHEVVSYNGLLSDYLKTLNYADVTVIRGLRSGYDLDYEMNQLRVLEDYKCNLPTAYFICNKNTSHVSSSMIRGLSKFPNSDWQKYIPKKYSYAK